MEYRRKCEWHRILEEKGNKWSIPRASWNVATTLPLKKEQSDMQNPECTVLSSSFRVTCYSVFQGCYYSSWILVIITVFRSSKNHFLFPFFKWGSLGDTQMLCRFVIVWIYKTGRKSDIPQRTKRVFLLLSFSPSSPWIAAFPSPSWQREPTPSPSRWLLGMPLFRTQKILPFTVSPENCSDTRSWPGNSLC